MHTRASPALVHWRSASRHEIRHLLDAHHIVRRIGPGGQPAAEQILHALVVQLAARFQRYSRDLHDAAAEALATAAPEPYRTLLKRLLEADRRLDRHNATSAVLTSDFRRFGLDLWPALGATAVHSRHTLDEVNAARNAIAHQDAPKLDALRLDLAVFRDWRRTLDELAAAVDSAVSDHLTEVTGHDPWNSCREEP